MTSSTQLKTTNAKIYTWNYKTFTIVRFVGTTGKIELNKTHRSVFKTSEYFVVIQSVLFIYLSPSFTDLSS